MNNQFKTDWVISLEFVRSNSLANCRLSPSRAYLLFFVAYLLYHE